MTKSDIIKAGRRLLGMTIKGRKPIFEPKPAHSLLLAAAGGGKTIAGAVPWLISMLADKNRAIVITDSKDGEIAAQCIEMCIKHGRKVAIIDEFNILGEDNQHKIAINPLGGVIAAHKKDVRASHERLMAGIDERETKEIGQLLKVCEKRTKQREKPLKDFARATDRRQKKQRRTSRTLQQRR